MSVDLVRQLASLGRLRASMRRVPVRHNLDDELPYCGSNQVFQVRDSAMVGRASSGGQPPG
jgi:hypothetical protein